MEWIAKMVYPVIKDCEIPEEARKKIIEWGRNQEPRDAACALFYVDFMNSHFKPNSEQNAQGSVATDGDSSNSVK